MALLTPRETALSVPTSGFCDGNCGFAREGEEGTRGKKGRGLGESYLRMMLGAGRRISGRVDSAGPSVESMFRAMSPGQLVFDIGLAAACWLLAALVYTNGEAGSFLALTGMATALALRRLSPALALGIAWVTSITQVVFVIGPDLSNLAILPVLYATARYGTSPLKWIGLASAGAGAFVVAAYFSIIAGLGQQLGNETQLFARLPQAAAVFLIAFVSSLSAFALSWTFGLLASTWRGAREAGQARILAERQRIDAQRTVAVEQERNRIARDMHDVVAHSLAVVIAQADGARYAGRNDPKAVDAALTAISTTAREALGDVRILLGQLRHSQDAGPQPVLADLDRLLDQFRTSGLLVEFEESGSPRSLPTGAQLAVYRIVQESLTNALRHGERSQGAIVSLDWESNGLALEIRSTLRGDDAKSAKSAKSATPTKHEGHGLAGMAERAALVGGSLRAVARDGYFTVSATIPASPTPGATADPDAAQLTGLAPVHTASQASNPAATRQEEQL